jgi:hypothetical protein
VRKTTKGLYACPNLSSSGITASRCNAIDKNIAIISGGVVVLQQRAALLGRRVLLYSGLLSAKREYLHVRRGKLAFDICGAPFGTGFFLSCWLAEMAPSWGLLYLAATIPITKRRLCIELDAQANTGLLSIRNASRSESF